MAEDALEGTVTILFTDVEGSTELRTRRGDEAADTILRAQEDVVRREIEAHAGRGVKALGDGFMVAFPSARKAVACAVSIQQAIHQHNQRQPASRLMVRIGLNSGEVSVDGGDLYGAAVNAAARVAAKAKGGEIMVSGVVKQLAGKVPDAEFVDRGRFRLKGFEERWQLFEVKWEADGAGGGGPASRLINLTDRTPLVGREAEREELLRLLEQARGGRGALVMIGGEPGVGKTRLTEEVGAEAQRRGMLAYVGRSYESEGTPPYIGFVEVLEAALKDLPEEVLRQALGGEAAEIARLVPDLRRRFPDIPPPLELPPDQERRYLFNSVREMITRSSTIAPQCIVFDDLHWADESALLLLEHVAPALQTLPILILGTYRDVELDLGRPLARTLESLLRQRLATRMSLRRLPQAGVATMLEKLGGAEPPEVLVGSIYAETEGNPFFVEEVFRHLAEEGKILDDAGRWRADLELSELDVPESVRLVIGRRLERLGESTRRALAAAAIIGRSFNFSLLSALGGDLDADALLDAVDDAERAGLVRSEAEGTDVSFTFAHELIRQTLLSGLSIPRRQRLHMRVAEAMESVYSSRIDEVASDIAYHLLEGGASADPERTAHFMLMAGKRAQDAAAFEDAMRKFDGALQLLPDADKRARAEANVGLGKAYRSLGESDRSQRAWGNALDLYEDLGDIDAVGKLCEDMAFQYGWASQWEECLIVAGRGLGALADTKNPERASLLSLSGAILGLTGNHRASEEMTTEGLELAESLGDSRSLGNATAQRALHHWAYAELGDANRIGARAVELFRADDDLWRLCDIAPFRGSSLAFLDRVSEAVDLFDEIEPIAARLGHLGAVNFLRRLRNQSLGSATLAEYTAWAEEDLVESSKIDTRGLWQRDAYCYLGVAAFWAGDWEKALENFRKSVTFEVPWVWNALHTAYLIQGLAYAGHQDEAIALMRANEHELPVIGEPCVIGRWGMLPWLIDALLKLGKRDEAAGLYPLAHHVTELGIGSTYNGRGFHHCAGQAAAAAENWSSAESHFESELKHQDRNGFVVEQAEVRRVFAGMLAERDAEGDRARARSLLEESAQRFESFSAPAHLEMTRAALATL